MRIVICGQKEFGAQVLGMLIEECHTVRTVVAPAPLDGKTDRLAARAAAAGIPVLHRLSRAAMPGEIDVIVCAHAHDYLPKACRDRARFGAIGYHPSLLPVHRGKDAIRWAIKMGDPVTGGTVYQLTDEVDAGPILAQEHVFIRPGDTPDGLWRRDLFPVGIRLLKSALHALETGQASFQPQDEEIATWEPSWERESLRKAGGDRR